MQQMLDLNKPIEREEVVSVCAWCHRARIITADFKIVWSDRYSLSNNQVISHTICPACKEKMMATRTASLAFC